MYGALINAADDSAVAATNCRRESSLRDMAFSPGEAFVVSQIALLFLFLHLTARPKRRALLDAAEISFSRSDQNCRRLSRNQLVPTSRTYVACGTAGRRFVRVGRADEPAGSAL